MNTSLSRLNTFFLSLISHLPFWLLYLLADLVFIVLFYLLKYRRKVTQTNLANAFPEKSVKERNQIERKFYRFLGDMIVESLKMNSISEKDILSRCQITNPELVQGFLDQGHSVLLATGHYGNWEWGNLFMPLRFHEKMVVIYKPLSDKNFGEYLNKIRSRFGTEMIPMKLTMRKIIEMKNEKYMVGFASDQTPTRHESKYFTNFLNQPTAVFLGLEKIAKATNHPVVFVQTERPRRGYYEYTFITIAKDPSVTAGYEITDLNAQKLEQVIRRRPELWLWSHKRWKFTPQEINQ